MHDTAPWLPEVRYTELFTTRPGAWLGALASIGFDRGACIAAPGRATMVMQLSTVRLLVSAPVPQPGAHVFCDRVSDLALSVAAVAPVITRAAPFGITLFQAPATERIVTGERVHHAVIGGVGTARHTLIDAGPDARRPPGHPATATVDHVCFVLPPFLLAPIVHVYADVLALSPVMLPPTGAPGEVGEAWYLRSARTTLVFAAPAAGTTSRLSAFLDAHGPGIHHLAIRVAPPSTVILPDALSPDSPDDPDHKPGFVLELLPPAGPARPGAARHHCTLLPLAPFPAPIDN